MSMSPPSPNPTVPSLQFPDLFNAALSEYSRKTGTDIATNPFAARFNDCNTSEAVLGILEEHAGAFNQFRRGNRKTQLIRWLKPTVDILLKVSTNDVVVQGISLVWLPRSNYPFRTFIIYPAGISTGEYNIFWHWSPARSLYPFPPRPCLQS